MKQKQRLFLEITVIAFLLIGLGIYVVNEMNKGTNFAYVPITSESAPGVLPINGLGPSGEKPEILAALISAISALKKDALSEKKYRIAVSMHDVKNDWSQMLLKGLIDTLSFYGLSPIVITDAEFDVKKQLTDYENIAKLQPDALITLPVDGSIPESVYGGFNQAGTALVFVDSVPGNLKIKENYFGWSVGDSFMLGDASAEILAKNLNGQGKIALLLWSNSMFTVDRRVVGAKEKLKQFPGLNVVKEVYFDEFFQIKARIGELLDEYPDLEGLWAVWDTPAFEAVSVVKQRNASVKVVCVDMNKDVARSILKRDVIVGTAADHPYDEGVAVALMALAALEHIEVPRYIVIPAEGVSINNIAQAWRNIYQKKLDDDLGVAP